MSVCCSLVVDRFSVCQGCQLYIVTKSKNLFNESSQACSVGLQIGTVGRIASSINRSTSFHKMSRPAVLPEIYSGEKSWDEWIHHFESIATVNEWNGAAKLNWLRVWLTGRAGTVFRRLPGVTRKDSKEATKTLRERFEPESKNELYLAEWQTCTKKRTEDWAAFGEDLKLLVDKAYPDFQKRRESNLCGTSTRLGWTTSKSHSQEAEIDQWCSTNYAQTQVISAPVDEANGSRSRRHTCTWWLRVHCWRCPPVVRRSAKADLEQMDSIEAELKAVRWPLLTSALEQRRRR